MLTFYADTEMAVIELLKMTHPPTWLTLFVNSPVQDYTRNQLRIHLFSMGFIFGPKLGQIDPGPGYNDVIHVYEGTEFFSIFGERNNIHI